MEINNTPRWGEATTSNVSGAGMPQENATVTVYKSHREAEDAIRKLTLAGFDMTHLSLVGKGFHSEEHPVGFYTLGDKVLAWGGTGAFWGAIWGVLLAPAVFFLPGLGMVAMAGPLVSALVGGVEGAVVIGGASSLAAALTRIGYTGDEAIRYESAVRSDQFVLMVHGSAEELARARDVLGASLSRNTAW